MKYDVDVFSKRLAEACQKIGLRADVIAPTRVRVYGRYAHMAEVLMCRADANDPARLWWTYAWGQKIAAADDVDTVAELVSRVVVAAGNPANVSYPDR